MQYGRAAVAQAIINHKKIARSAIRLKHSIAADNELNEVMPVIENRLVALAQQGRVPELTISQIMESVEGEE